MPFDALGLTPALLKTLADLKYAKPYTIQERAIPAILDGKDILGIAKTGSGKTASYVLPILMNLLGKPKIQDRFVKTLVLVPTRELAMQVEKVFRTFSENLPEFLKIMAVYGGVSINPQMKNLFGTHVLIATPGRLIELLEANALQLINVDTLVLDEADKMLNVGFKEQMDRILMFLPNGRQNLLFSATLSKAVENIHQLILNNPQVIKITPEKEDLSLIVQEAYLVNEEKKGPLLRYLIKTKKMKRVLIFTSSVYKADNVADKLRKNGINAQATHSKKSQKARTEALQNFKEGNLTVLVATDLLSRGIDIESLPFVINYELPRSPKDYVHRIGRTGRAAHAGQAISILTSDDEHHFKVIQKKMKQTVPVMSADDLDFHGY